jgi:DNA invertase Pin-like site-specific DNA recombinase
LRDGFPLVALGLHVLVHRAQVSQALLSQVGPCTQFGLGCHLFTWNGFGPEPMPVHFQISANSEPSIAGPDKDSEKRQRAAIAAFAKAHGYELVGEYYDSAVSGADPIGERAGFRAMLDRIAGNGVRTILVESPDRFARDLTVQLTGHDYLKSLGVELIPTSAPDFFTEDTPTAVLVRQVLGAIAQFEKTSLVAKLKAARDRKKAATGKCGGRKTYAEARPEVVAFAKELRGSLRKRSAELAARGYVTASGKPYSASAVQAMLG